MATGKRIRTNTVPDFDALPEWIQEKFARDLFEILEEEEANAITGGIKETGGR